MSEAFESLLAAILKDDRPAARKLVKTHRELSSDVVEESRLYETEVAHWLYAGDTALHLAAAGYRVEIAQLLLASGADPNFAQNHRVSGPLHYASDGYINGPTWNEERQVKTIRCLLEAGADANAQEKMEPHRFTGLSVLDASAQCAACLTQDAIRRSETRPGRHPSIWQFKPPEEAEAGKKRPRMRNERSSWNFFLAV